MTLKAFLSLLFLAVNFIRQAGLKMADFTIDARQLKRLDKSLAKAGISYKKGVKRFLKEIGTRIVWLAKKYCPESPQIKDYKKMNKSGTTRRKNSSITSGSLRESIRKDVGKDHVSINVPANSKGGKYGERIHDKKGIEWQERGIRTKQKGEKADEKFIFRAYSDSQ